MKKFLGLNHPFFLPLWRRVLTVAALLAWTAFELFSRQSLPWAAVFGGLGLYCAWVFFVDFDPADHGDGPDD